MPQSIRFHLDENVNHAIANGLRIRGIDVTTSSDVGLIGASDPNQLAFARSQGRVLLTHDDDFLTIHGQFPQHAGLVFCYKNRRTIGQIIDGLILIWEALDPEDMQNKVEYI
jgi:predicted nuclease of predicted toxin-antitoxin system